MSIALRRTSQAPRNGPFENSCLPPPNKRPRRTLSSAPQSGIDSARVPKQVGRGTSPHSSGHPIRIQRRAIGSHGRACLWHHTSTPGRLFRRHNNPKRSYSQRICEPASHSFPESSTATDASKPSPGSLHHARLGKSITRVRAVRACACFAAASLPRTLPRAGASPLELCCGHEWIA